MRRVSVIALLAVLTACTRENGGPPFVAPAPAIHDDSRSGDDRDFVRAASAPSDANPDEVGIATWYGREFAGKRTASGERFDPDAMTAAHRKLPFGTWVEVRRPDTGRSVRVRVNDRGPWGDARRVIDLSRAAAKDLGMLGDGKVRVELRVVHGPA
jgi:rare lipoprotein A